MRINRTRPKKLANRYQEARFDVIGDNHYSELTAEEWYEISQSFLNWCCKHPKKKPTLDKKILAEIFVGIFENEANTFYPDERHTTSWWARRILPYFESLTTQDIEEDLDEFLKILINQYDVAKEKYDYYF